MRRDVPLGLSQMEPASGPRCAVCGATLAVVEAEQPYTIEFASDQRVQGHPKNVNATAVPERSAGTAVAMFFWTASTQEGESQ